MQVNIQLADWVNTLEEKVNKFASMPKESRGSELAFIQHQRRLLEVTKRAMQGKVHLTGAPRLRK